MAHSEPVKHTLYTALEQYIATHILQADHPQQALWRRALKCIAILCGVTWGLPWIGASMAVAHIFPTALSPILAVVFAMGIVLTVGADGWWIMHEACRLFDKKSPSEKALLHIQHGRKSTYWTKCFFAWSFATLSCIAPVYASVKYSVGKAQLFAIITLVGYYGYGFIGYTKLIEQVTLWWRDHRGIPTWVARRTQLAQWVRSLAQQTTTLPENITAQQLLVQALALPESVTQPSHAAKNTTIGKWLRLSFTLIIPLAASVVSTFLIHDFLYAHVWANAGFAMTAAVVAEIPGFVISMLATFHVVSYLKNTFIYSSSSDRKLTPITAVPTTLSLLAPTAAGYITYTTLTAHHIHGFVIALGVVSISLARVVFSWFTLRKLLNHITVKVFETMGKTGTVRETRIRALADMLSRMDAVHFKF